MVEDWILPIIVAALILDAGAIWAIRLYRRSRQIPAYAPTPGRGQRIRGQLASLPDEVVMAALAGLVAGLCLWALPHIDFTPTRRILQAAVGLACAAILAGLSLYLQRRSMRPKAQPAEARRRLRRLHFPVFAFSLSLAGALLANYGDALAQQVAGLCWALAIVLAVAGGWRGARGPAPIPWQTVAWLTLLVAAGFLAYTHATLNYFYIPGTAILRRWPGVLFLLGAGLLVLRPKDERTQLLALWLAAFGLIGAASESTPAAQRYVASAPACALVIGAGLSSVLEGVERHARRWSRLSAAVVAILAIGLALDDARFYFLDYTPRSTFGG